jgi:hypothetical protein
MQGQMSSNLIPPPHRRTAIMKTENTISKTKNLLLLLPNRDENAQALRELSAHFCGVVVSRLAEFPADLTGKRIHVCGDIAQLEEIGTPLYIIRELSFNYEDSNPALFHFVSLGQVPVIVSNAGVYFRRLFEEDNYFQRIKNEHVFQDLTESTKPGMALRKGIYLTSVSKEESVDGKEALHYRLLRCSSNLSGPTDNFRSTDHEIMDAINAAAKYVFEEETTLNHVLAQIYENKKKSDSEEKESKARIKAHSDKTKDMPKEALIAFCTIYDSANFEHLKPSSTDRFDWCYKQASGLTRLHFKLKKSVADDRLAKEFSVTLYPNSVFFIPLSTNRLYTHEIRPSMLNIDMIPTRLGYVARCSSTEAIFRDAQTFIMENGNWVPLEDMTLETMNSLKESYVEENQTERRVQYGKVHFSMNRGDYQKPID